MSLIKIRAFPDAELIKSYVKKLKASPMVVLNSNNYKEHIACYLAWNDVGGNVFVLNPSVNDVNVRINLMLEANKKAMEYKDNLFFHTTGTTGKPKIAVHGERQIQQAIKLQEYSLEIDSNTKYLVSMPPSTIGFWMANLIPFVEYNSKIEFLSKDRLNVISESGANKALFTPSVINYLININANLTGFEMIQSGSSVIKKEQVEYLFRNKVKVFNHVYGSTECGVPVLHRKITGIDENFDCLEFKPIGKNTFKLSEKNELLVAGDSVCENKLDFENIDGMICTGDIFEFNNNLIKFSKRLKSEKINSCGKYGLL